MPALVSCALAGAALSQSPDPRPEIAVVILTLDDARQGQIKHGRRVVDVLGHESFGRFRMVDPTAPRDDFRRCEDDTPELGLAWCARFSLHRALTAGSPPHVVVAFTDRRPGGPSARENGDMRALCFGRGMEAADPAAQDIWMWTGSNRMHGVRDWQRDQDALAACIEAALSEPPGEPRPGATS